MKYAGCSSMKHCGIKAGCRQGNWTTECWDFTKATAHSYHEKSLTIFETCDRIQIF